MFVRVCVRNRGSKHMLGLLLAKCFVHVFPRKMLVEFVDGQIGFTVTVLLSK